MAPADLTPGSVRTRSRSCAKKAAFSGSGYAASGSEISMVKTWSGVKPGSISRKRAKLRSIRPVPIRSTNARATSDTTKALRRRLRRRPSAPRSPSLRDSVRWILEAWNAGANPKINPVATEAMTVKINTDSSMRMSPALGKLSGTINLSRLIPQVATRTPSAPPAKASARLSVTSWRMRRRRVAPKAERIATSRCREVARASKRFATLAQPISSTKATAPKRTSRAERKLPTTWTCSGTNLTSDPM